MTGGLSEKIEQARERALRLQKLSRAVEAAERKRDNCLYGFFNDLQHLESDLHGLGWSKKRNAFGDLLNFRSGKNMSGLLLRKIYPELRPKIRSKYAAVLRYVAAAKSREEKTKEFVRNNGGINGCVTKEKKLRTRAVRSKA